MWEYFILTVRPQWLQDPQRSCNYHSATTTPQPLRRPLVLLAPSRYISQFSHMDKVKTLLGLANTRVKPHRAPWVWPMDLSSQQYRCRCQSTSLGLGANSAIPSPRVLFIFSSPFSFFFHLHLSDWHATRPLVSAIVVPASIICEGRATCLRGRRQVLLLIPPPTGGILESKTVMMPI